MAGASQLLTGLSETGANARPMQTDHYQCGESNCDDSDPGYLPEAEDRNENRKTHQSNCKHYPLRKKYDEQNSENRSNQDNHCVLEI
jgi:hypothetical protein